MAFTEAQEAKLLQILAAFDNGKRLNELPHVGNVNPLDLIVEVMDTDGETKQAQLAALLPYLEEQCAYGIEWDTTVSSSACTRIGNIGLHKSLPIQNRMRGCLLDDNGTVVEYLNPANWRAHTLDGSIGQVMVEIPAHYRKFETDGTKRRCKLSELPLPGYHVVPKMYISAYEAVMERSTGKLCSVVNAGTDYRGGNNQVDWDGTYRSLLGRPVTVKSRIQFRAAARLRNASATAEWNCLDYNAYKAVFWLYYVEYANRNCQLPFNAQKDANGFAQGGLGNGVANMSEWSAYNGTYPIVPCGHSDEFGNASGEVAYPVINEDGTTRCTLLVNRYRGIENPFGHIWKWVDGINILIQSDEAGGESKIYVSDDPAKFNDTSAMNESYTMRGLEARESGYVKGLALGEYGEIIPTEVGAGSTTYWSDYHYTSKPTGGAALGFRGVLFGGYANYGAHAGFGYANSLNAPSNTHASVGSRLCFLPKK